MNRRQFMTGGALVIAAHSTGARAAVRNRDVLLMQRLSPTSSELFIANADGSAERRLLPSSGFDYHASFAPDGQWILFTSERRGRGQADLFCARIDGSGLRPVAAEPALEDAGAYSPDGSRIAYVATRGNHRANIWTRQIQTGQLHNVTGSREIQGDPEKPDGFFRPAWSPDGQWLAFSSDRNTEWRGHSCVGGGLSCAGNAEGWEHIQQLQIYMARPDGSDFRVITARPGYSAGSPKWSPDGRRVVFYEMPVEQSWTARIARISASAISQIVSIDIASGERVEHTGGPGLKLFPQFLSSQDIAYQVRGGPDQGLYNTSGRAAVKTAAHSPAWSLDGKTVIFERTGNAALPQNALLGGWDPRFEYRFTDSFPQLSRDGRLVITEQSQGSAIATMNADGSDRRRVFDPENKGLAFGPCWSPDGQSIAFGLGLWFERRNSSPAKIMRMRKDGSELEALTDGASNAGFPSYAPDGRHLVYRVAGGTGESGLRILDLQDRSSTVLTRDGDNLPCWSPDGARIVFTRRLADGNFDIFTIRPNGSDLRRLTQSGANDAHAVWTPDGRILWTSGAYGFKNEAALYEDNFQPYGQIWIMNADGSGKRALTDSLWEDGEPLLIPARFLRRSAR